ncbi:uncharacterized protein LOC131230264 [Magnolia sinica]|uniref:uncharacterized protein LOC131230264 n=1 Tax=Magnolia sinica TaxID=86752 RepID=UPI0026596BCD|nr:uncharacterized protein LOC131230264 [Magnolia sinica]
MNNLPPQFGTFLVKYNTLKDMWTLDELITQCVQEEDRIRQMVKVQNVNMVTSGQGQGQGNKGKRKRKQGSNKGFSGSPFGNYENQSGNGSKRKRVKGKPCFFCKKTGHLKKDCEGFKDWLIKKGIITGQATN